jgi:hypothetical protein
MPVLLRESQYLSFAIGFQGLAGSGADLKAKPNNQEEGLNLGIH